MPPGTLFFQSFFFLDSPTPVHFVRVNSSLSSVKRKIYIELCVGILGQAKNRSSGYSHFAHARCLHPSRVGLCFRQSIPTLSAHFINLRIFWTDKLYLIGGGWPEPPTGMVQSFRPRDAGLREEAALLVARHSFGVTSSQKEIVVCGGFGFRDLVLSSCEVFQSTQNRSE